MSVRLTGPERSDIFVEREHCFRWRHEDDHRVFNSSLNRRTQEFKMKKIFARFVKETDGQDVIEYALLAATIGLGTVAGMTAIKDAVNTEFTNIGTAVTSGS